MKELPLFVYGTLRSGESQAALLGRRTRDKAWARGQLFALPAGYPALLPGGDRRVEGELVHDVDQRLLGLLDAYEGVDEGLFRRVALDVYVGLRAHQAWVYTMESHQVRGATRLPDGRWRAARRR